MSIVSWSSCACAFGGMIQMMATKTAGSQEELNNACKSCRETCDMCCQGFHEQCVNTSDCACAAVNHGYKD
jgi:hypothetical protein